MSEYVSFYDGVNYREFKSMEFKRELMLEYVRYMLDKSIPMFQYGNLPETIPQRKLEEFIQTRGFVAILPKGDDFYAVTGGRGGERDAYYEPLDFVFANPYLGLDGAYRIGKECELIRNDSYIWGLYRYTHVTPRF